MINRFFDFIDTITDWAVIAASVTMCIVIFLQVICRYGLNHALPWSEELGRFLFLGLTYFGITLGMKKNAHLRIEVFILYMPNSLKKFFNVLSMLIVAAFFLFIAYNGFDMTRKMYRIGQDAVAIPLPIWCVWALIPLSAMLSFLQACRNAVLLYAEKMALNPENGESAL